MTKYKYNLPEEISKDDFNLYVKRQLRDNKNVLTCKLYAIINLIQPCNIDQIREFLRENKAPLSYYETRKHLGYLRDWNLVTYKNYNDSKKSNSEINKTIMKKHIKHTANKGIDIWGKKFDNIQYYYLTSFGQEMLTFCLDILGIKYEIKEEDGHE